METKEIMVNEEVIETTEEIVAANSGKGLKVAAIGLAIIGGAIAYTYLVKPIVTKIKAKKEKREICVEFDDVENTEIEEKVVSIK